MADLENLKLDADALGIKYRSDIKAETLQGKIDDYNKENNPSAVAQEVTETIEPTYQFYKNTSGINVFTESGRCSPNKTVSLTESEAKQYAELELCEK